MLFARLDKMLRKRKERKALLVGKDTAEKLNECIQITERKQLLSVEGTKNNLI